MITMMSMMITLMIIANKYSENNVIYISCTQINYDDTNYDNSYINNDIYDDIDDNGIYLTDNNNL